MSARFTLSEDDVNFDRVSLSTTYTLSECFVIKARGGKPLRACVDFNLSSLSRARKFLPALPCKIFRRNSLTKYDNGATPACFKRCRHGRVGGEHCTGSFEPLFRRVRSFGCAMRAGVLILFSLYFISLLNRTAEGDII